MQFKVLRLPDHDVVAHWDAAPVQAERPPVARPEPPRSTPRPEPPRSTPRPEPSDTHPRPDAADHARLQRQFAYPDGSGRELDLDASLSFAGALVDDASPAHEALCDLWIVTRQRLEMVAPDRATEPHDLAVAVARQPLTRHVDGHVLVTRDITERVATTQELHASSQRLRTLFDQSPIGAMMFDLDLIVTECNDRFAKMVMLAHDDVVGFDLKSADHGGLATLYQAALRGETSPYRGPTP